MKLDEPVDIEIEYPNHNFIIYFLMKDNEIVYIGKSSNGLSRAFSHIDKDFDNVKIILLPEHKINEKEAFYILKYKPIYNITVNTSDLYHLKNIRNHLKKQIGPIEQWIIEFIKKELKTLNINHVKSILSYFNITTYVYRDLIYIDEDSLEKLKELIRKDYEYGNYQSRKN